MNYMIIVDDGGGEMKAVSAAEIAAAFPTLNTNIEGALDHILDQRAIAAGEYDPSDNDTPIVVTVSEAPVYG